MSEQLSLFELSNPAKSEGKVPEFGTFKDSLRSPVHNWFRYPAGYSHKFVNHVFAETNLLPGMWVYDPFSGSGTTLLCAQQANMNGYGVEAHSFVHWVAEVKLFRNYDFVTLRSILESLVISGISYVKEKRATVNLEGKFPELVYKCYHIEDLQELYLLKEFVASISDKHIQDLLKLALTDTLRSSAAAGTGWPYISPRKNTGTAPPKGANSIFNRTVFKMYSDLKTMRLPDQSSAIYNVSGDSRTCQHLADGQIDLALTSPPYLNNFDYADRTRLETYFWGITDSWSDITKQFRNKLIISATTQVVRRNYDLESVVSKDIEALDRKSFQTIQQAVSDLSAMRTLKSGKKDYDLMVALYFNDMFSVLLEAHRILRTGGCFYLVLGDSAPYGVHIQTDNLIGHIGVALGFRSFEYQNFRSRGGKWKNNPQRHTVELREGVVILKK